MKEKGKTIRFIHEAGLNFNSTCATIINSFGTLTQSQSKPLLKHTDTLQLPEIGLTGFM